LKVMNVMDSCIMPASGLLTFGSHRISEAWGKEVLCNQES